MRYRSISGAKGIAALLIAIAHYFFWTGRTGEVPSTVVLTVDFFFVCGGFLMFNSLSKKDEYSDAQYLRYVAESKLTRLYLPYLVLAVIEMLLFVYVDKEILDFRTVAMVAMLGQGWGFSVGEKITWYSMIGIAWYLSIDLYLSLILMPILKKLKKNETNLLLFCGVLIFISANCLLNFSPNYMEVTYERIQLGPVSLPLGVMRGILGYSIGVLCYYIVEKLKSVMDSVKYKKIIFSMAEVAIAVSVYLIYAGSELKLMDEFAFPVFAVFIVTAFSVGQGILSYVLATKPFVLLGELSFAIYLVHPLVIRFMKDMPWNSGKLYLAAVLIAAAIVHFTVERACVKLKKKICG